ncbi:MAG TPA: glycoside hydrolase family 3 N-terminal domain-containing protein [Longimicrobiales bacterium]
MRPNRSGPRLLVLLLAHVGGFCGFAQAQQVVAPTRMNAYVDSLLSQLTVQEKAGQLTQWFGDLGPTGQTVVQGGDADLRAGKVGSFLNVVGAARTCELQRIAVEQTRLHIPLLFGYDVIHGYRTTFPVPLAEAASWDTAAVREAARIAADEATAHGVHWTFAPMVDIARDPRWGRIVEGSGEDAYLGSAMAAARVHGFQGESLASRHTLMATAKHYTAYGAAEGGRDYNVADISERTLREVYLPPFRAAVNAGSGSLMAAFNEIAGLPMHANRRLLTEVLRAEWGFDGVVVSDWTGIQELMQHGIAARPSEAARAALQAGVDVDMVSNFYLHELPGLLQSGAITEAQLDEAVRRVLRAKYRLGLFDDPYRYCDTLRERTATLTPENLRHARQLARESIVLLKNEAGALPLKTNLRTVAVIGSLAADSEAALGPWAAQGQPRDVVTILSALRQRLEPRTRVLYARGADPLTSDTSGFARAVAVARQADVVILVVGENREQSGEAHSRADIGLPGVQLDLARRVMSAGKRVVVVLMNGRPLAVPWLADHAPAVLETWFLGVQMGPAVTDVLLGDYNPAGKLPVTFPRVVGQVPIYYNHKNTGRPPDAANMYTSKYTDVAWTPLYPFGHGLSYTTFSYSEPRLSAAVIAPGDSISVDVTVVNTGQRAGAEVVQLYVRDDVASVTRPVQELRGFRRIVLRPGQAQAVSFTLGPDDLALYDENMQRVVEPGTFTVFVGGSSAATKQAHFTVEKRIP